MPQARKILPSVSLGVVPEKADCVDKVKAREIGSKFGDGSSRRTETLLYFVLMGLGLVILATLTLYFDPAVKAYPPPQSVFSGMHSALYKGALALGGAIVFTIFTLVSTKKAFRQVDSAHGSKNSSRAKRLDNVRIDLILSVIGEYFCGIWPYL